MDDKACPESSVTLEVVSNHKLQQAIESLYRDVEYFRKKTTNKTELQKFRANLKKINDRLRKQERHIRKESMLVKNPPFNARTSENVDGTLKFVKNLLGMKLSRDSIKACHILPKTEPISGSHKHIHVFWWKVGNT